MRFLKQLVSLKNNPKIIYLALAVIILLGLFFRTYKLETFYTFNHDQDLYSWIVKDILVDHHFRLIGQLTSIDGVFIGPLFYYLLVPFFALFNMDPIGANVLTIGIGLATILSLYFVFSRFFGKTTGIIGAFLFAVSWPNAFWDKWVVPTQPTIIWSLWYLYALLLLMRGDFKSLIIIGVLFGLIWHIHVALLPLVLLVPLALFLSKKRPPIKSYLISLVPFLVLTSPFWLFEIRHDFQQISGFINSLTEDRGRISGISRFIKVIEGSSGALIGSFLYGVSIPALLGPIVWVATFLAVRMKKIVTQKEQLILLAWIVLSLGSQFVSKRPISEYYFINVAVTFFLLISLLLSYLYHQKKLSYVALVFLAGFFIYNLSSLLNRPESLDGYIQKKRAIEYIKQDALVNGYPCISINYITDFGNGVGFYYLLWFNNLHTIKPGTGAPVYNIVIPWDRSRDEIHARFGAIGIILPKVKDFAKTQECNNPENEVLPLLGFTK